MAVLFMSCVFQLALSAPSYANVNNSIFSFTVVPATVPDGTITRVSFRYSIGHNHFATTAWQIRLDGGAVLAQGTNNFANPGLFNFTNRTFAIIRNVTIPAGTSPGAHFIQVRTLYSTSCSFNVASTCRRIARVNFTVTAANDAPSANAGPDQVGVLEDALVTLDGTASSDPNGDPLTFSWTQVAGSPTVTLSSGSAVSPTFTAPFVSGVTTLTFELEVEDPLGLFDTDSVDITVANSNTPPVADAGDDTTIKEGALATLDGTNSFDNESDPINYTWTQLSGTTVTLNLTDPEKPTFTAPSTAVETLIFQLVTDDDMESSVPSPGTDATAVDRVAVTIVENSAPVADAGSGQSKNEHSEVTLNGTGSFDPDGDGITYLWTQLSGSTVALDDDTSDTPKFIAPAVMSGGEALVFKLTVTDDDPINPKSDMDQVTINVLNINDPPSCDLAEASTDRLWPPNHKMKSVEIDGVMDEDDIYNMVTLEVTGVTQDEPIDGTGDGDTSPDAVIQIGDPRDSVLLRAERSGNEDGRVYVVSFFAFDGFEGCNGQVTVGVPHSRKSTAIDSGQTVDSTTP